MLGPSPGWIVGVSEKIAVGLKAKSCFYTHGILA